MKKITFVTAIVLLLNSCGSNSSSDKELELREKELELRERELALQESGNSNNDVSSDEITEDQSPSKSSSSSNNRNTYSSTQPRQKSEEELKRELALKECESPTRYLRKANETLNGTYKNALSMKFDGFKLKFNIQNSATLITFKNVRCRVTLTSNSGSTILSKNFTVNEFVRAGSSIYYTGEFSCTNQEFNDTDKFSVEILGAECH
jgi:hypothetical protein